MFGKTKYKILSFAVHMCAIFLKSCLVKMKPLDHKIVDAGNFRNGHKISWNKQVSLSLEGVHR